MCPTRSELIVKVVEEGIKIETDTFSMLFTEKDIRILIKKLENALFDLYQITKRKVHDSRVSER